MVSTGLDNCIGNSRATTSNTADPPALRMMAGPANSPSRSQMSARSFTRCISAATIAGHFPLTLVTGAGAEARNSIGLVLVGGMAIGTLFTLFVIPSIYMLIARDRSRDLSPETAV